MNHRGRKSGKAHGGNSVKKKGELRFRTGGTQKVRNFLVPGVLTLDALIPMIRRNSKQLRMTHSPALPDRDDGDDNDNIAGARFVFAAAASFPSLTLQQLQPARIQEPRDRKGAGDDELHPFCEDHSAASEQCLPPDDEAVENDEDSAEDAIKGKPSHREKHEITNSNSKTTTTTTTTRLWWHQASPSSQSTSPLIYWTV